MDIQLRKTATVLDDALDRIGNFFGERQRQADADPVHADDAPVVVDIGALGVANHFADADPGWYSCVVFPIRISGNTAILGPLCGTDGTAGPCPRCLDRRWQAIRPFEERRALSGPGAPVVCGAPPELTGFALEAMWAVFQFACGTPLPATPAGPSGRRRRHTYELQLHTLQVTPHTLIADSECPVCARPTADAAALAGVSLRSCRKPSVTTYRLRPAAESGLRTGDFVSPVCGVLGTAAMRAYQCTVTSPVSGFFQIRSKYDLHESWWSGHADGFGLSEIYGVLEGLERYAGNTSRSKKVSVYGTYQALRDDAVDPRDYGIYSPDYYATHPHQYQPFAPDVPIHWVWGYSLLQERAVLVPEQLVYYLDWRHDQRNFVQECSNGCASGSCPEEALLYALLELVERDAFLLSWYARRQLTEIDLDTCTSPETHFMRGRLSLLGYDLRIFDMRFDLKIPAVMGVAVRRDGALGRLCFAAGAGFEPEDAVRAALCEVASYVPQFDDRVSEKLPELTAMAQDYRKVTDLMHHSLLYGLPEMAVHADFLFRDPAKLSMDDVYAEWLAVRPATLDLLDDVRYFVDSLRAAGMADVIAVDQTCPEQRPEGIVTFCALVPGLIPIDFGWEKQRALVHPRLATALADSSSGVNLNPHPFP